MISPLARKPSYAVRYFLDGDPFFLGADRVADKTETARQFRWTEIEPGDLSNLRHHGFASDKTLDNERSILYCSHFNRTGWAFVFTAFTSCAFLMGQKIWITSKAVNAVCDFKIKYTCRAYICASCAGNA